MFSRGWGRTRRAGAPGNAETPAARGFPQCAREDSNLHGLLAHKALNLARLPIPPQAQASAEYRRLIPSPPGARLAEHMFVKPLASSGVKETQRDGFDQAPAGDLRFHQALFGPLRVPADGAGHRQGRRPRLVLDRAPAPGQPREDRAAAPRPVQAARDRAARPGRAGSGRGATSSDRRTGCRSSDPSPRASRCSPRRTSRSMSSCPSRPAASAASTCFGCGATR